MSAQVRSMSHTCFLALGLYSSEPSSSLADLWWCRVRMVSQGSTENLFLPGVASYMKTCGLFLDLVLMGKGCSVRGNGQAPSKQGWQTTSKQGWQLFTWKTAYDLFSHLKFRKLVWNRDCFPLNNISSAGAGLHLSQIKILYLCLIVIHSLVYGPCILQGVLETNTVFLSATFCIQISGSLDGCVQSHTAVRQLPLDSVSQEEQEGKLFQLRSAST